MAAVSPIYWWSNDRVNENARRAGIYVAGCNCWSTDARVQWMKAVLLTLDGQGVQEALEGIAALGIEDVGIHLFKSGRCAIAHATGQPVINPDDPRDALRLYRELPVVREMAIRAIEERFGIATRSTEYAKHLYELRGWKELLGEPLVSAVLAGQEPQPEQVINLPSIHVRLRESPTYKPLENMVPKQIEVRDQQLFVIYQSPDGLAEIRFVLALAEERLKFDVYEGIYGHDDGSVAAAEYRRDTQRFFRDYMLNGELQFWNAENDELLSRLDAFLPLNVMINLEAFNADIAVAQQEVDRRQAQLAQP